MSGTRSASRLSDILLAFALAGCSLPAGESSSNAPPEPARLTVELAAAAPAPGALSLVVESLVLMPDTERGFRNWLDRRRERRAARPAFLLALEPEPFLLDPDGAVLVREVRIAPGRYRKLRLELGARSAVAAGSTRVPLSGGGTIPIDLELAPGEAATLTLELDAERSLQRAPGGPARFEPVLVSAALRPGAAEAHGGLRGRVVPADAGAMIVIYDAGTPDSRSFAFADPHSGDFVLDELPVGDYRIEINPLAPAAFEARVLEGVGVPWNGFRDLGAIDVHGASGTTKAAPLPGEGLRPGEVEAAADAP